VSTDANKFPQPSAENDYFMLTLEDPLQTPVLREIVKCTARSANNFTIIRAQEGFVASAFRAGATVSNRITAGTISALYATAGAASQLYLGAFSTAPTETNSQQSLFLGLLYYNTTSATLYEYDNGWVAISSGDNTYSSGQYLGASAVAPTTRPSGGALQAGDLYYNTSSNEMFEYTDGAWVETTSSVTNLGATTIGGDLTVDGAITTTGDITSSGTITADVLDATSGTVALWDVTETLTVGASGAAGTVFLNGLQVVDAGDLSGSANSQNWPNGTIEYWGEQATGSDGIGFVVYPEPFPHEWTFTGATVVAPGDATPPFNGIIIFNRTVEGFSVASYNAGGLNGPVSFDWEAKGN
jgi:hypothetical protein